MELWSSKYRPTDLNDMVLPEEFKIRFKNYIKTGSLNHCLFYGKPGTGKTTTAMVLKNYFIEDESDCLFLNASNDRGIDTIRYTVLDFMKIPPYASKLKLVIMDEADNLTADAWKILRSPIENKDDNPDLITRFIFTANIESKIPDFIKSRCDCYGFTEASREGVLNRCEYILISEEVEYNKQDLSATIDELYPDIRAAINAIQKNSIDGKFIYTANVDIGDDILKMSKDVIAQYKDIKKVSEILFKMRQLKADVDYISQTKRLMNDDIPLELLPVINHYLNSYNVSLDHKSHYNAMLGDCVIIMGNLYK